MKKKILLIDSSITVQKVVSLTLDRHEFNVLFAKSKPEALQLISDEMPHAILVSQDVSGINYASFPKELEVFLGRDKQPPPVVLLTTQDVSQVKHYHAVLKKPFTPAQLMAVLEAMPEAMIASLGKASGFANVSKLPGNSDVDFEEEELHTVFDKAFSEKDLVHDTLIQHERSFGQSVPLEKSMETALGDQLHTPLGFTDMNSNRGKAPKSDRSDEPMIELDHPTANTHTPFIGASKPSHTSSQASVILGTGDSMVYKSALENQVKNFLETQDFAPIVSQVLTSLMPPIVERLVNERLDMLLKEQEKFVEIDKT